MAGLEKPKDDGEGGRLESDVRYYGRQRARDIAWVLARDPQGIPIRIEAEKDVLRRIGAKRFDQLVIKDEKGHFVKAKSAKELVENFGDVVLVMPDPKKPGETQKFSEAQLDRYMLEEGFGVKQDTGLWGNHEMIDKAFGARGSRETVGSIFAQLANKDFIMDEYKKNPESILEFAKVLPFTLFKSKVLEEEKIARKIKLEMWARRRMGYVRRVVEVQAKVDSGEIAEFGAEWGRIISLPYMEMMKIIKNDEFKELIKWDVPITTPDGTPYMATLKKNGDLKVSRGGVGKPMTFEDLRQITATWQGSGSTAFMQARGEYSAAESRNITNRKRRPLEYMRNKWAAIQIVLGEEGNQFLLPDLSGDVGYYAATEARKWAQSEISAMTEIIKHGTAGPEEVEEAEERLKFAKMIEEGPDAIPELKNLRQAERDKKVQGARASLMSADGPAARQKLIAGSTLCYMLDQLIILEGGYAENASNPTGIAGWNKFKNKDELQAIIGKKEMHTPSMVFGMPLSNFTALLESLNDPAEIESIFTMVLILRERAFIDVCIVSDDIRSRVAWPNTMLLAQIQKERDRRYPEEAGNPLPINPFAKEAGA